MFQLTAASNLRTLMFLVKVNRIVCTISLLVLSTVYTIGLRTAAVSTEECIICMFHYQLYYSKCMI